MNRLKSVVALLATLVSLAIAARAQDGEFPKFDKPLPSEAQVLRMGYEQFNAWAYQHAPAMNEVQADNLAVWYSRIREKETRRLGADARLQTATKALQRWASDRWNLSYMQAGGGTIYIHSSIRETAVIADLEAKALRQWRSKGKTGAADAIRPYRDTDAKKTEYNSTPAKEYEKALADETRDLTTLKAALRKLPPAPQAIYEGFMSDLVKTRMGE